MLPQKAGGAAAFRLGPRYPATTAPPRLRGATAVYSSLIFTPSGSAGISLPVGIPSIHLASPHTTLSASRQRNSCGERDQQRSNKQSPHSSPLSLNLLLYNLSLSFGIKVQPISNLSSNFFSNPILSCSGMPIRSSYLFSSHNIRQHDDPQVQKIYIRKMSVPRAKKRSAERSLIAERCLVMTPPSLSALRPADASITIPASGRTKARL